MSSVQTSIVQQPGQWVSQHLAVSQHQAAPSAPSHSGLSNVLKKAAIFGGVGAAAGLGASLLGLPVIGCLSAPITAAIGGALGVAVGAIVGLVQNHRNRPPVPPVSSGPVGVPSPPPPGAIQTY